MTIQTSPVTADRTELPPELAPTPELVAKTITGIPLVGCARNALLEAGWNAIITANRIMVDRVIEAQLISSNGRGWWHVYRVDGRPPLWVVGATVDETMNWIGAVE